jgi:hypothetical protein
LATVDFPEEFYATLTAGQGSKGMGLPAQIVDVFAPLSPAILEDKSAH